jgi:TRAP transporter TAXI family solute receptor
VRWRSGWLFALAALAMAGVAGAAWWFATRPTTLRVAVVQDGDDLELLTATARILQKEGAPIRLVTVPQKVLNDVGVALESGAADLAVVRSDVDMPASGETVAVLHRNVALLIASTPSGITGVPDLANRKVGIVRGLPANERLLDAILAQYEVPAHSVKRELLAPEQVSDAMAMRDVEAVLVVGPLTGDLVGDAVRAVSAAGGPPVFVPIPDAEAMALRRPAFEALEVVRGAFGGSPPKPSDALQTVSVTFRLVAHSNLDNPTVSELTRRLFQMRTDLVKAVPAADRIEAPNVDKGARLPVHPGSAAYFENEEQTFMERYGDWFYIAAMVFGFGASGFAAVGARMRARLHRHAERVEHLLSIVRRAREAETVQILDGLETEADGVFAETLAASSEHTDQARLTALSLALEHVRHAISERRRHLESVRPIVPAGPRRVAHRHPTDRL